MSTEESKNKLESKLNQKQSPKALNITGKQGLCNFANIALIWIWAPEPHHPEDGECMRVAGWHRMEHRAVAAEGSGEQRWPVGVECSREWDGRSLLRENGKWKAGQSSSTCQLANWQVEEENLRPRSEDNSEVNDNSRKARQQQLCTT